MQVKFHAQTSACMNRLKRKLIAHAQSSLGIVEERITALQSGAQLQKDSYWNQRFGVLVLYQVTLFYLL